MKYKILIIVFAIILSSCSVPFKVYTDTDKFNPGVEVTYTSQITIKHSNPFDMCEIYLQYVSYESKDNDTLGFYITYVGEDWAFIENIKLLIDGKVYKYSPFQRPDRDVGGLLGVTESMQFMIPKEIFELIQEKGFFEMRISGQKRTFDIAKNEELVNKMRIWYSSIHNK